MTPFTRITAPAAPIDLVNVDTDRIVPARFLRKPRSPEYARYLFHDLRFADDGALRPDFVLNQPAYRDARILVAAENFACGSSREGAVWALDAYGIRAVIAPSLGDISPELLQDRPPPRDPSRRHHRRPTPPTPRTPGLDRHRRSRAPVGDRTRRRRPPIRDRSLPQADAADGPGRDRLDLGLRIVDRSLRSPTTCRDAVGNPKKLNRRRRDSRGWG